MDPDSFFIDSSLAPVVESLPEYRPPPSPEVAQESDPLEEPLQTSSGDYNSFKFESPAELLCFVYPDVSPYKWQIEETTRIAAEYSQEDPLLYILRACNGSGKDSIIMASIVGWLTLCKIRHRVVMTSSSGVQLSTQSEKYISDFFKDFNKRVGFECVQDKQRYYFCEQTGSEVILFATDEAGKAEGYHPFISPKGSEMAIIINEAKSVDADIIKALSRCTGYSRRIEISTPGAPSGHFYEINKLATRYPAERKKGEWFLRIVTAKECPHITQATINAQIMEYGLSSPIVRSSIYAEFSEGTEDTVIKEALLWEAFDDQPPIKAFGDKKCGIDIGLTNDEAVMLIRQGNHILGQETFRLGDTTLTASKIITLIKLYSLLPENCYADDGGVGKGVIDQLQDRGYMVNRVLFNNSALRKDRFLNRGAELYFFVSRLIEERLLNFGKLDRHDILFSQLTGRRYFQNIKGKLQLESKKDAKSRGQDSPDRGDAFILSFCGETLDEFLSFVGRRLYKKEKEKPLPPTSGSNYATQEQLAAQLAMREHLNSLGIPQPKVNHDNSIFSIYNDAIRGTFNG